MKAFSFFTVKFCKHIPYQYIPFFPEIHRERSFPLGISSAQSVELDNVVYFKTTKYCYKILKWKNTNSFQERLLTIAFTSMNVHRLLTKGTTIQAIRSSQYPD